MTVVVELSGGLGNQLFQYAFGRAISFRHGCKVKFDSRGYPDTRGREFDLPKLTRHCEIADFRESDRLLGVYPSLAERIARRLGLRSTFRSVRSDFIYREPQWFQVDPCALAARQASYYQGYWQCVGYFDKYRDELVNEITPVEAISAAALEILDEIQRSGDVSVSVHIRKGDYKNPPDGNRMWDVCTDEYYRNAVQLMSGFVSAPRWFIFSDEPGDIDATLFHGNVKVIPASINAVESIHLMASCRHHIIANSSFSWWGAYLSRRANGVTVFPDHWMQGVPTPQDLVPPKWLASSVGSFENV
jgi:hypothetical protein